MAVIAGNGTPDEENGQGTGAAPGAAPAPVLGVTTREQFGAPAATTAPMASGTASASGAAPGGTSAAAATPAHTPSAAPGTAATTAAGSAAPATQAQNAGQAPAWTNLATFLGHQSSDAGQNEANPIIQTANNNAAATTAASTTAANNATTAINAGTDHGSFGLNRGVRQQPGVTPTYDFSKVNLAGYTGPTDTSGTFGGASKASTTAASDVAGHAAGPEEANAFDQAVLKTSPAWSKVQAAVGAEGQAAQDATARAAGAQEQVNQAQGSSQASVGDQKSALTAAGKTLSDTATTNKTDLQSYKDGLNSVDAPTLTAALNKLSTDPAAMAALGLDPARVAQLRDGVQYGFYSIQYVHDLLTTAGASDAAGNATGYDTEGADEVNKINGLLNNGAPKAATGPEAKPIADQTTQGLQNEKDLRLAGGLAADLNSGKYSDTYWSGPNSDPRRNQVAGALAELHAAGYTPEQISQLTGLTISDVNQGENYANTLGQ